MVRPPQSPQVPHMLRAVIEGIHTGVLISNDRYVIYSNPEINRLLGYAPDDALAGMPITDLVADGDQLLALQRRKAATAGRRVPEGWVKLKAKNGEPVQMMLRLSCVVLAGRPYFITAAIRVSDSHRFERQARAAGAGYQQLLVAELEKQQSAIARELHDSLGSELTGISLMLGGLKSLAPGDAALCAGLDNALGQLQVAIEMTRGLACGLMPVDAYAGDFWRALERLADEWTFVKGLPCEFSMVGEFGHVPAGTGTHLYRIAQEAIANALRHGKATRIRLRLAERGPDLTLDIEDNGAGFGDGAAGAGMGLGSMKARAASIGGCIEFLPVWPHGHCVTVVWRAEPAAPKNRRDD
jgi:PAS domain S-box-containing protein